MRLLFNSIFLVLPIFISAQGMDQKVVRSEEVFYGKMIYQRPFLNLNSINTFNFSSPPEMVGFNLNASAVSNRNAGSGSPASIVLGFIITDKINYTDSIVCNLNGYILGINLFGFDIFQRNKNVDFIFTGGFNFGRLRLSNSQFNERNSLVAPKIMVQSRIKIKKLALSVSGEYQFDVSNQEWHKLRFGARQSFVVQKFKQSGYFIRLSLGMAH
jgi:hypothetical protein